MNPTKRRLLSSVLSGLILLSMVFSLVAPFGSNQTVQAQEATDEPPVESTDSADPLAGSPTPEATQDTPPVIPVDGSTTPDDLPIIVNPSTTSYGDDFQDADTVGWSLSEGWALTSNPEDGNIYLTTNGAFETATVPGLLWDNVAVSARLGITPGNTANIALRVGAENYNVTFSADGSARLFRSLNLLAEASALEVIEADDLAPRWYDVSVQALGDTLTVSVNGVGVLTFTDSAPLAAGAVVFSSGVNNTGFIMLDDVNLQQVAASPVVTPDVPTNEAPVVVVPVPTETEVTSDIPPFVEVTAESTAEATEVVVVEATAEATDEATDETTAEATPAPENTPAVEITAEATADVEATEVVEATPEVEATDDPELTPEATPELEVTAEVTPEAESTETPEPSEEATLEPVAFSDFDGQISGWSLSEGTTILAVEDGYALSMNADSTIDPEPALFLADFRADARVNVSAPAEGEIAGGLDVNFHINGTSAYRVAFGMEEIALYSTEGGDTETGEFLLTSVPATLSYDTWYALSLTVTGGEITLTVDGADTLSYTVEDGDAAGEINFGASSALLIDDIAIYDLSVTDESAETVVPFALTDENVVKVGQALFSVLASYVESGEDAAVAVAQAHFMTLDEANRVRVQIWGVGGQSLVELGTIVAETDSVVINLDVDHVNAYASFEALIDLANRDEVAAISLPAIAVSTSVGGVERTQITQQATGGTIKPHSLDIIGANIWHEAGVLGAGVVVGVIDTSFAGASIIPERDCLNSATPVTIAGDVGDPGTGHGLNVVEVICDIAPSSTIVMYRASSVGVIDDAINRAASDQVDIIVITIDDVLGGGQSGIQSAIQSAYGSNIPVIASAGNTGATGGTIAFGYDGESGRVNVRASAGSVIDYSWVEPNGEANYPSTLSLDGEVVDSRNVRMGGSVQQYVVPERCGESCELDLEISGEGTTTIQVLAAGGEDTAVTGGTMVQLNTPSTLTTAANSPNAIAVGAVCASQAQNYPILATSSAGPPIANPTGNTIKPEVVAPSFVQTSLTGGSISCTGAGGVGFGGTSAAAAHVAGMAALLFTEGNTANAALDSHFNGSFLKPQRLELYLMGHTIDLHEGSSPDGFDNTYGAGLTVLGSPFYNINQRVNYTSFADPDGTNALDAEAFYVGNADLFSTQTGTPSDPFFHIETAIQAAIAAGRAYVILQPGEYAGGFSIPDPTGANTLTLSSFDGADIINRFGSSIVVTDVGDTGDGGGIHIDGGQGITVQGIDFTGSSPLYLTTDTQLLVIPPTPIYIRDGTDIIVQDNTFSYFDQPLQVTNSTGVEILNNAFTQFIIPFTGFGVNISSLFNAGGINVQGTGTGAGNMQTVLIEGNSFTNNEVRHTNSATRYEGIIRIARMEAQLYNNRFVDNIAGSTITIDQWVNEVATPTAADYLDYEVVIYSSLFEGNSLFGPLIHLYQGINFQFVNNSVINHNLNSNPSFGSIISVGGANSGFLQVAEHRFNIINNLFFNNDLEGSLLAVANNTAIPAITLDCSAIGSNGQNNGVRNSWFIDRFGGSSGGPQAGQCNGAVQNAGNNNFFGSNAASTVGAATFVSLNVPAAVTTFENATFFLDYDLTNPYRLLPYDIRGGVIPTPTDPPPKGVDVGSNAAVNSILGYDIRTPPVSVFPLDVMGLPRLIDRTPPFTETTSDDIVDIGAYELSDPQPVSFIDDDGSLNPTTSEDTEAITFDITERVQGGFQPYSFAFTNLPALYDTNPFNPCEGQPIKFDDISNTVTYCPPNDFHTSGAGTPVISFDYTASGILDTGTTPLGTVTVVVQPVNDGVPTSNADTQVIFTDLSTQINYRLRPYVEFSPDFNLSDPDDDDSAGTPSDVDYPFTFTSFVVDASAPGHEPLLFGLGSSPSQGAMNSAIAAAVSGGVFNFTPAPGISGAIEFSYSVTDRDGGVGNRRVRLVVTTRLAGPGLHDDASLDFVYDDGWLPYYFEPAINNTWHYTATGSSVDFYFIGDAFGIHVYGFPGAASMQISIDPDDVGPADPANYNTFAELTCSNPTKPSPVPTSVAVAKTFVYGCTGVESIPGAQDQLHRLRITNATPGVTLVIDAISVRDEGLPPGVYQDDDFMVSHSPLYNAVTNPLGWTVGAAAPSAVGGSFSYTGAQNANMTFQVDGDLVDTMVIYRTLGPGWGPFDVYVNGARRATVQNNSATVIYSQAAVVTGIGSGIQNIEIRNISPAYIIIEAIELLAAESPLTEGVYPAEDGRVSYIGAWADYVDPSPNDGSNPSNGILRYSVDPNAVAVFRINGSGVSIDRTMATGYGQIEVCLGSSNCKTFGGSSSTLVWGQPATVRSTINTIQTVTVRSLDTGAIGIDSIEVIGAIAGLEPGYYEEVDPALAYSGVWTPYVVPQVLGGSAIYSNDPDAVISFPINASTMERLIIHYPGGVGWGAMRVCGTVCSNINLSQGTTFNNVAPINKAALGLSNETLATVTIQSNGGFFGIEAIQILTEPGPLAPGYYEETSVSTGFDLTYNGTGWTSYAALGPRGGNMRYTNLVANTATFQVVPNDIDGIVFYHTGGVGYGGIQVCNGGTCQIIPNASPTFTSYGNRTFISKASLNLPASSSPSTITVRPETNGLYIGLEGLHIVATDPDATPPNFGELPVGVNKPTVSQLRYAGSWVRYTDAVNIPSGVWEFTTDASAAVYFVADGTGLVINHGVYPGYAPFEVCVDGSECKRFSSDASVFEWGAPTYVWFNSSGVHNVEIRSIGAGVLAFESIEVVSTARPVLTAGNYYEETNSAFQYNGLWSRWTFGSVLGGTARYSLDPAATMSFLVDATNVDEIVVFHPQGAGWGSMQICRNTNDNCQTITLTNAIDAYNVAARISTGAGANGLNLPGGISTITIKPLSGYANVEAIQLVTAGALVPGYYEETPQSTGFNLTYNGGWTSYAALGPRGGSMRLTASTTDNATFSVIPNNIDGIVIYHTGGPGYGGMQVCNGGTCQTISNPTPAVSSYGNRTYIPKANLNLTGGTPVEVTIRAQTNGLYIGLEALQIIGAGSSLPLLPDGLNSSSSTNLKYVGSWSSFNYAVVPPNGPLAGTLTYSGDPSAAIVFRINGAGVALYRTIISGWGAFEMCIDGNQCQTFTSTDPTTVWGQAVTMRATGGVGEHIVEIRSVDGLYLGIEAIEVLDPIAALTPGIYQDHDPDLTYTNVSSGGLTDWTNYYVVGMNGNSSRYTNDPADSLTFSVNANLAQRLVIYHNGGAGWGTMQVCNAGQADCVTRNLATSASLYANQWIININNGGGANDLDLTGANAAVTIRTTGGLISVEAIEVRGAVGPLLPGSYEQDNFNLTYTGAWVSFASGAYSGGTGIYTGTPDDQLSFQITDASGFSIVLSRLIAGYSPNIRVCYTRASNGDTNCNITTDGVVSTVSTSGIQQDYYLYSYYGLPSRNVTNTGPETYTVTVNHNGPTLTYLLLDAILVHGEHSGTLMTSTTPGTPNGQPVTYDTTSEYVTYAPSNLWTNGIAAGYFGSTYDFTTNAGAFAQASIEGNSVTIYQLASPSSSRNVRFCVVQDGGDLAQNLQCTNFSQNVGVTVVQSPITLYGFGYDQREIIFENRDYGYYFFIDALAVR